MGCFHSKRKNSAVIVEISQDLFQINPDEIDLVPLKGQTVPARVVSVYDGDSFTVIFHYGRQPMKINVRLDGLDTPEKKPQKVVDKVPRTEEELRLEKAAALKITEWVSKLLLEQLVYLHVIKWDKYGGRLRCKVSVKNQDLTQILIKKQWAREYHGEKKTPWTIPELKRILK